MCTFANVRWCELTGMTMSQALGAGWSTAVHPDDRERLAQEGAQSAATGQEMSADFRLQQAGGRELWVHISVAPILGADDRPNGYLTAVTDVSDRKRAEAEKEELLSAERAARRDLADQTERLDSVIAAAIPGILVSDENGLIAQLNKSFCDLFGIEESSEQLVGTATVDLVLRIKESFADPSEFIRRTGAAFTARQPVHGEHMACADGRTFECDYWPVLVDGGYRGDLWMGWDVSEREALAEQRERLLEAELAAREAAEQSQFKLAEQNARLKELDEAKTQFLATMSHELRTPLTSIVSFTELILDDQDELTPDTVSALSVIQRNAERLLRLVGDLLLLSKLESGGFPLDLAPVSVPDLVGEAIRSASATAAERGITVEVSAADGPPVQADRLRLEQVMDNLLSNAIKFSGQDGRVRVQAGQDGHRWRIDVSDDGIGIPADELGLLFARFVRASNARLAGLPGTGLGLSVVKAITELHGGTVAVRSTAEVPGTAGHGTTFTIYLPISP
jgi:PAS domain S-box-containing protein